MFGKKKSFIKQIEPLINRLENFALAMCKNRETAKDLVADTLLISYEQFEEVRHNDALLSYLFTICRRQFFAKYYTASKIVEMKYNTIENLYRTELNAEDKLDIEAILNELDKMDVTIKEAVILFFVNGFSQKEIAELQGKSVASVKMSIHRAKKEIRQNLNIENEVNFGEIK